MGYEGFDCTMNPPSACQTPRNPREFYRRPHPSLSNGPTVSSVDESSCRFLRVFSTSSKDDWAVGGSFRTVSLIWGMAALYRSRISQVVRRPRRSRRPSYIGRCRLETGDSSREKSKLCSYDMCLSLNTICLVLRLTVRETEDLLN